ncbi:MAG: hypothetical protein HY961_18735 [Ignavibacteriae bacterium]|nr:hypothetical protein [Ignavibacteriota bacterium]
MPQLSREPLGGNSSSMNKVISSNRTVLVNVILPGIFGGALILTAVLWIYLRQSDLLILIFVLGFMLFLNLIFLGWAKNVRVSDDCLYVSKFKKEQEIPHALIERVSEIKWLSDHYVTIHLRESIGRIRRITFIPKASIIWIFRSHPIVAELISQIKKVKGTSN